MSTFDLNNSINKNPTLLVNKTSKNIIYSNQNDSLKMYSSGREQFSPDKVTYSLSRPWFDDFKFSNKYHPPI